MLMASPRLLFSTAAFFARPLGETFGLVAEAGYAGVEVMVTKDPASQDPRRMRDLAEEHGLAIGAIHAPCLLLTRRVWGTDPIGKIHRSVEVAAEVGAPLVVVHPPYRWQFPFRRWLEDRLPAFTKESGIEVAVENMFPVRMAGRELTFHANQDLEELEAFDSLVLDTSHAAVAAHDLLELRSLFGHRLRHVHLSDNAGRGWDSHLPLGEGVLPIDPFLDDLEASSYDGTVTLEVDLRRHMTEPDTLLETMRADRVRCEARLSSAR
jgi:sugar phosphate isomerase/epimerase